MGNIEIICEGCGVKFVWTEEEQRNAGSSDAEGELTGGLIEVEPYCKKCRPKQDQQRA